jgi:hypothetical protein
MIARVRGQVRTAWQVVWSNQSSMSHARVATQGLVAARRALVSGRSQVKKTLVFIDGENLIHPLNDGLFSQEQQLKWDGFLAALLYKDDELVRIYWQPQKAREPRPGAGEATQLFDPAQRIANEARQRVAHGTAHADVQKKRYATPKLLRYEEMKVKYPVVENIQRVHIVRLLKGNPPISQSVSRTLTIAGRPIDVYESQVEVKCIGIEI